MPRTPIKPDPPLLNVRIHNGRETDQIADNLSLKSADSKKRAEVVAALLKRLYTDWSEADSADLRKKLEGKHAKRT